MMARLVQSQLMSAMTAFFRKDVDARGARSPRRTTRSTTSLGFIEEKCFERIAGELAGSPRSRRLRGVFRVALNLEKLGDYAVNVAEQAVHVSRLPARPDPLRPGRPGARRAGRARRGHHRVPPGQRREGQARLPLRDRARPAVPRGARGDVPAPAAAGPGPRLPASPTCSWPSSWSASATRSSTSARRRCSSSPASA